MVKKLIYPMLAIIIFSLIWITLSSDSYSQSKRYKLLKVHKGLLECGNILEIENGNEIFIVFDSTSSTQYKIDSIYNMSIGLVYEWPICEVEGIMTMRGLTTLVEYPIKDSLVIDYSGNFNKDRQLYILEP